MTAKHLTKDATSVGPQEQVSTRPTRAEAIRAILDAVNSAWGEGAYTEIQAESTLDWIALRVAESREQHDDWLILKRDQMDGWEYTHFKLIFPHCQTARANSAADVINRHLLDPSLGESCIMHNDVTQNQSDFTGFRVGVMATAAGS